MTPQTPDPRRDLDAVAEATARFLEAVRGLSPDAVAGPSGLPDWTRGHLLTHVARHADSLVNLLTWARTGVETPQYESGEARTADIEKGADRPLEEHIADLERSAERLQEAGRAVPDQAWAAQVVTRTGHVLAAAELPWRRLFEVWLHHVDLAAGFTTAMLPDDFTARALESLVDTLHAHEGIAAVRLRDADSGAEWELGAAPEPEATVTGTRHALLAWVSGRSGGEDLEVSPQGPLPKLPPLG